MTSAGKPCRRTRPEEAALAPPKQAPSPLLQGFVTFSDNNSTPSGVVDDPQ
jgi:hypothetical protein